MLWVGRKWEMGQEERAGLVPMVFMIVCLQLMFLLLASVVVQIENNDAYFETVLRI